MVGGIRNTAHVFTFFPVNFSPPPSEWIPFQQDLLRFEAQLRGKQNVYAPALLSTSYSLYKCYKANMRTARCLHYVLFCSELTDFRVGGWVGG